MEQLLMSHKLICLSYVKCTAAIMTAHTLEHFYRQLWKQNSGRAVLHLIIIKGSVYLLVIYHVCIW